MSAIDKLIKKDYDACNAIEKCIRRTFTTTLIPQISRDAAEQLAAMQAERTEMLALLKEIEWVSFGLDRIKHCPKCGGQQPYHGKDCKLDAMIKMLS
jgi:hypothetical protein